MQLQTILPRVERHKGFVYGKVVFREAADGPVLAAASCSRYSDNVIWKPLLPSAALASAQLDVGIFEDLLDALCHMGLLSHELRALPSQIPQFPLWLRGHLSQNVYADRTMMYP
jgi:hypothetical protein